MSPAAGPASPSDRSPSMMPAMIPNPIVPAVGFVSPATEMVAKDAIIAWYRGEFAAANAIIDALCNHLTQLSGGCAAAEYEAAFAAIHRRRLNWIPVLQMQKYFSIADVTRELRNVAAAKKAVSTAAQEDRSAAVAKTCQDVVVAEKKEEEVKMEEKDEDEAEKRSEKEVVTLEEEEESKRDGDGGFGESVDEDSPNSEITDTGSHEGQPIIQHIEICENHEDCGSRREQIKMTKGFVAKEPVKGHMVNVVKGLKMYENIFKDEEITKMNDFVYELRAAGQNGELLGETYILFNKQMKGNKREQVHLGFPIFGTVKDDATGEHQKTNIAPIPMLLQSVVDHLVQWQIIPETRKPNGCIINYFDEGEYSQPYLKPPHVDQPICTLLLSETTLAFGRTLVNDGEGNFKGHLMLSVKAGSVLVMRNNSADMARHVMCPSATKRVSLTFFRVRPDTDHNHHIGGHNNHQAATLSPLTQAMTLWQPGIPSPCSTTMVPSSFEPTTTMNMMPKYGVVHGPMLMLAPMSMKPVVINPKKMPRGGTGVFLPWANKGSRKPAKHLPPRAQRSRLLALPPPTVESHHIIETMSDPGTEMKGM